MVASRGVIGHGSVGTGWLPLLWGDRGGAGVKQGRGQGSSLPTGNSDLYPESNGGLRRRGGWGTPCQSLHCVHLPTSLPPRRLVLLPPLLSPPQPLGSVWLIKEEEGSRHDAVCLGPFAPARPGTRSKGPSVELPLPSLPLSGPASPPPPPSRNPFL